MDDNGAPAAAAPAEGEEPMSKSALKRKLKASSVDQCLVWMGMLMKVVLTDLGEGMAGAMDPCVYQRAPFSLPCPTL